MLVKYENMQERIIANSVVAPDGPIINGSRCWLWIGKMRRNRQGTSYPAMSVRWRRGKRKGKVRTLAAHRESLKAFKNRNLKGKVSGHLCNNTICVNPDHLFGGTQSTNIKQAVNEGRHNSSGKRSCGPVSSAGESGDWHAGRREEAGPQHVLLGAEV